MIIDIGNGHGLSSKCSAPCQCLQEDKCNNISAIHVSYTRRHFTETLCCMERFRSDIDVSRSVIINVFTENKNYSLNGQ